MSGNNLFDDTIYLNSSDNKYRYALGTKGENTLYCIGVNPSTATPEKYDPTIMRVRGAAVKAGFDSFVMLNIYPLRATDPNELPKIPDEGIFDRNMEVIYQMVNYESAVWAAWGDLIHKRSWLNDYKDDILDNLQRCRKNIHWVKMGELTKSGNPRHPLYLKYQPFSEYKIA
jgi:hypothetical protein